MTNTHIHVQVDVVTPLDCGVTWQLLKFLRNGQTVFHSGCTICILIRSVRGLQFLHILNAFCLFHFNHSVSVKWFLTVVWIPISLVTNDVEYLLICLLAISVSSLEKGLFKSFAHFLISYASFCCWLMRISYLFWILDPYHIYNFQIFSHKLVLFFNLVMSCDS